MTTCKTTAIVPSKLRVVMSPSRVLKKRIALVPIYNWYEVAAIFIKLLIDDECNVIKRLRRSCGNVHETTGISYKFHLV